MFVTGMLQLKKKKNIKAAYSTSNDPFFGLCVGEGGWKIMLGDGVHMSLQLKLHACFFSFGC